MTASSYRLLLVEDNGDDRALTARAFRLAMPSIVIVIASDGIEALEFFAACREDALPKLVVIDLNMPRLDGFGLLEAIRANPRTRLLPVLVLTSSVLADDVARAYASGANSYLVKPIDFVDFKLMASLLLCYWLTANQTPQAQVQA